MSKDQAGQRYAFIDLLKVILTVGIVFRHAELVGLEAARKPSIS